jgi:hypothetical protein
VALPLLGLLAGSVLAGCAGSEGASLARQACREVASAGTLEVQAGGTSDAGQAAQLRARATRWLMLAEPTAARAAGDDATWQALSANLLEVNRLPISLVMPALRADCLSAGISVP